jgi:hypothetical protein
MASRAECGFPSPADDYLDRPLDFNDLLIENPAATFAVRIAGESMTGAGLFPGDIAVVDRSRILASAPRQMNTLAPSMSNSIECEGDVDELDALERDEATS